MSLLLDALNKASEENSQSTRKLVDTPHAVPKSEPLVLDLEPTEQTQPPPAAPPEDDLANALADRLDHGSDELILPQPPEIDIESEENKQIEPPETRPADEAPAEKKETTEPLDPQSLQQLMQGCRRNRQHRHLWLILIAMLVIGLQIAAGYWYYLQQSLISNEVQTFSPTLTEPLQDNPLSSAALTPPLADEPATSSSQESHPLSTGTLRSDTNKNLVKPTNLIGSSSPESTTPQPNKTSPAPPAIQQKIEEDPGFGLPSRIIIKRTQRRTAHRSPAASAYQALQQGRTKQAERLYRKLLQKEPHNRDALLGLAALALQWGDLESAEAHYQQLLRHDPHDADVLAALALLEPRSRDPGLELRLRRLAEQQPDNPRLHFALASRYAARQEWRRAQQAYFDAWSRSRNNPDYAFNLAVALDHLGKITHAANYYRKALELARSRPASFTNAAAQQRLTQIDPAGVLPW
jgi:tetratricopeptide (TPR) repeat protein